MKKISTLWILLLVYNFLHAQQKSHAIIPDHIKLQYAGTIGFLSLGGGYELGKKDKLELDLYFGYVPKSVGGVDIEIITTKLTWKPLSRQYANNTSVDWLTTGALLSYTMGRNYHLFSRASYSFAYYGYPTAGALAIFAGGAVSKNRLGLYYEISINDRELFSFVPNAKSIPFTDILNLGFGAKYTLFE